MTIWCLVVTDISGGPISLFGNEVVLRAAYEEIREGLSLGDITNGKMLEIHGMCDSADRAESSLVIRVDQIRCATLTKMWG